MLILCVQPKVTSVEPPLPKVILESEVHRLAQTYGQDENRAKEIIKCEANAYHEKGSSTDYILIRGVRVGINLQARHRNNNGTTDFGPLQVNSSHTSEMGNLDITKWEDSLEFGFQLMKREGVAPWSASKPCWNN